MNTLFVFGRQAFAFSDDSSFFCPYFKEERKDGNGACFRG